MEAQRWLGKRVRFDSTELFSEEGHTSELHGRKTTLTPDMDAGGHRSRRELADGSPKQMRRGTVEEADERSRANLEKKVSRRGGMEVKQGDLDPLSFPRGRSWKEEMKKHSEHPLNNVMWAWGTSPDQLANQPTMLSCIE